MAGGVGLSLALTLGLGISRGISAALKVAINNLDGFVAGWDEKAQIATAISKGDLDRDVTRSAALEIDASALSRDETGQLLTIVRTLSQGQLSFEGAITNMTQSLRQKRREEAASDPQQIAQLLQEQVGEAVKFQGLEHA
ncbi:hypothetical protein [Roseateles oligotrophus]|uniref:Uncharacterized protein n=1 Tax=Roseateles oligotrophus TaxID=1769250 RepID=A0ABT2YIX6_9BURK|nr:hypothetical protein [Roseateles oligotrophus]MCV2369988.1 hypothetical protein [Roseateles oligotrophus]